MKVIQPPASNLMGFLGLLGDHPKALHSLSEESTQTPGLGSVGM